MLRCVSATSCVLAARPAADSAGDSISHHETTPAWHQMLWLLLCHQAIIIIMTLSLGRFGRVPSGERAREPHPNCGQELDGKVLRFPVAIVSIAATWSAN
ncbi:hypothetical protein M441DRAFT_405036 [Trichoderma asperellum CBS 433.97]|uniref:Uncharacterized protein n=1 Tax=Trichoderma asperellum (strain ATCC 204424 / CBS 433.97 / NBRC 101777) TaxID=1042311 RepID=A0A2T3ZAK0_TRIA4|nr:hypothetical protein M441DRAFT_405036 [Trichoderma asperellum CBS 433.97]PTB41816.1 hypothetical protein M441DRAFT_405036 [Trichoderma asperellum CBS 433.97]